MPNHKFSINNLVNIQPIAKENGVLFSIPSPTREELRKSYPGDALRGDIECRKFIRLKEVPGKVWSITIDEYKVLTKPKEIILKKYEKTPGSHFVFYNDIGILCGSAGVYLLDIDDKPLGYDIFIRS